MYETPQNRTLFQQQKESTIREVPTSLRGLLSVGIAVRSVYYMKGFDTWRVRQGRLNLPVPKQYIMF
jgi:hypothetical protein